MDIHGKIIKYRTPQEIAKWLDSYSLSYNSIIVGALDDQNLNNSQYYSEYSMLENYISVSAIDSFWSNYETKETNNNLDVWNGTSLSAPTITAIASILKTNYSSYFDKGSDSLIMKSALIAGSRNPQSFADWKSNVNDNIYDEQKGFGSVKFDKVRESLKHIRYEKIHRDNTYNNPYKMAEFFYEPGKYRINITWENKDSFETRWVRTGLFSGETKYEHIGPVPVDFEIQTDWEGKKIPAKNYRNKYYEEQKTNTKTIEINLEKRGWYYFNLSLGDENRRSDLDVAFTYSKI
ncbi:hypothetical protein CJJ23_02925 [Mycoplasmopsis agassizii]|uniref:Peptidase S8/S53 domain-containing protein n=1 Tax=Mycoplasmopsis agassizii TaxID=33922 RepID=A0A269TJS1_9BACT|nr:S8 family serine peptidase [Mycoplasmopsis agassizii]PAK21276.1 hypothetical protein CJJ23_02925 [Mycoplasmopsis agassizii]